MISIEFDADKDAINVALRGLSLARARQIDEAQAVIFEDDRFDYGEVREIAIARIEGTSYTVVFTRRPPNWRIISLRKADKNEREIFAARRR